MSIWKLVGIPYIKICINKNFQQFRLRVEVVVVGTKSVSASVDSIQQKVFLGYGGLNIVLANVHFKFVLICI